VHGAINDLVDAAEQAACGCGQQQGRDKNYQTPDDDAVQQAVELLWCAGHARGDPSTGKQRAKHDCCHRNDRALRHLSGCGAVIAHRVQRAGTHRHSQQIEHELKHECDNSASDNGTP
jgi:hypothetical protein